MNKIAKKLLKKNPKLAKALDKCKAKEQYKTRAGLLDSAILARIGQAEGTFIKKHKLVWAIINAYNGTGEGDELDY